MANNISVSPYWLTTGQTIAAGNKVNSISVLKYIIVPAVGGVGSTLQYKSTVTVTTQQIVPANETWKIESVAIDLTANSLMQGVQGVSGATGATGPEGCTNTNYILKSNVTNAACSQIFDDGANVGIGTNTPGALLDLGVAGTKAGVLRLAGSSSGNTTIQTAAAAGSTTLNLPATSGNLIGTGAATSGQYASAKYTTTTSLNWANGNVQHIQLANGAQTFTFANSLDGGRYVLFLKQPSSGAAGTVTWPATVLWSGGTAPTLTTTNDKVDVISFIYDATNTKYYALNISSSTTTPTPVELYTTPLYNDPSLVAYWRLEGNSNDSKGSNNGTDNSVTYGSIYGKFAQGWTTSSTSGISNFGNPAPLQISGTITVSFWIKVTGALPTSRHTSFVSSGGYPAGYNGAWGFTRNYGGGGMVFLASNGSNIQAGAGSADSDYSDGTWHHIVGVYVPSTRITLYIDGVKKGESTTNIPASMPTSYSSTIGYTSNNCSICDGFNWGNIDDVAIFNRALSPYEVFYLYNGFPSSNPELYTTPLYSDASLVSYWRMEGNSNDSKGINNGSDNSITYGNSYGKFGQGASFSSASSSNIVKTSSSLPTGSSARSISLWFKTSTTGVSQSLVSWGTNSPSQACILYITAGNVINWSPWGGQTQSTTVVTNGLWHHVVWTTDGVTGHGKLYIDGIDNTSSDGGYSLATAASTTLY
ncbi:MAG: LamG domain-containing protein, partial [Bacteroidetes bacterium]|nr:LamG domain-containing protein [Bacteroidota bacterium]